MYPMGGFREDQNPMDLNQVLASLYEGYSQPLGSNRYSLHMDREPTLLPKQYNWGSVLSRHNNKDGFLKSAFKRFGSFKDNRNEY